MGVCRWIGRTLGQATSTTSRPQTNTYVTNGAHVGCYSRLWHWPDVLYPSDHEQPHIKLFSSAQEPNNVGWLPTCNLSESTNLMRLC